MADVIYKYGPIDPTFDYMTVRGKPVYVGPYYGTVVMPNGLVWHLVEIY